MYAKSIHIDTQTKEIYFMLKSKRNEKLKFVKLFLIENHVVFLVLIKLESLNKPMITKQKKFTSLEYRNTNNTNVAIKQKS